MMKAVAEFQRIPINFGDLAAIQTFLTSSRGITKIKVIFEYFITRF